MFVLLVLLGFGLCAGNIQKPGKLIGKLETIYHGVTGDVYVSEESDSKLNIINFNYDGEGPATVFWIGLKGKHGPLIDSSGILVPDENGQTGPLKEYKQANITINLPNNIKSSQVKWLAVWCQIFKLDFGHVFFP
ncbi:hypothetical protein HELRODRAFT_189345 [Helobdella robusta]|uniref:DM13 domain-containing protein n=1 Tax=Helobdella robusta TaxID=6412 RepID=T1FQZ5_HELRO|nr:hypothetical protein HELRODRAFT_189345 [Helobdella robusta]ESN96721.1 hypothetical protein HELRODRAFT_189345 [Helobdella robusta]